MRITSSSEYGTRIMVQLARAWGGGTLAAKDLAARENIPRDYVGQILVRLRRAGLVRSRLGTKGGYALSRDPSRIHMAEIVRAVEGEVFEEVCGKYTRGSARCRHQDACGIRPVWVRLGLEVEAFLRGIPLTRLLEPERQVVQTLLGHPRIPTA